MKIKIIVKSIILVIIFFVFIYYKNIYGWFKFKDNNYTNQSYKSVVHVSKQQYSNDSLSLIFEIKEKIKSHQEPYTSSIRVNEILEYINNSVTKVYIDTIFYNQNLKKIAFLVIVENENKKLYRGMSRDEADGWTKEGNLPYDGSFFDGNCFIAKKENNTFKIYYYGYHFTNSKTYKENSNALRDACLNRQEDKNKEKPSYNIDDKRFWNTDDWNLVK